MHGYCWNIIYELSESVSGERGREERVLRGRGAAEYYIFSARKQIRHQIFISVLAVIQLMHGGGKLFHI